LCQRRREVLKIPSGNWSADQLPADPPNKTGENVPSSQRKREFVSIGASVEFYSYASRTFHDRYKIVSVPKGINSLRTILVLIQDSTALENRNISQITSQ
jgi:hypothetical protein